MNIIVHTHLSPRIIEVLSPTTSVTVQEIVDAVRDWEDDNLSFDKLLNAAGKEELGGGVTVGITATLQNARLMFTSRTTPLESAGTCTTNDPTGKVLHATGGQFVTNGIYKGCTIKNHTTGSMATVTEIISETELKSFQLTGGSRTTWLNGDTYDIYPNVQCSIEGGNLVAVDSVGAELSPVIQSPNVQVVRSSSSSATLQELSAIQYSSFGGGVTVDVVNGEAGTAYPIGTKEMPVNNLNDAVLIAISRGFDTFFIKGDITLSNTVNLANFTIQGESIVKSKITIEPSALVFGTELIDATITGTLDGDNTLHHCAIQTLNYVQGHIHNCLLEEYTITLGGTTEVILLNCWSAGASQDATPIIDMGGSGKTLIIRGHSGGLKLINKSGSEDAVLDFESGRVVIDSTIIAGKITIRGIGQVVDNSTGTAVIDISGVVSQTTIAHAVWEENLNDYASGAAKMQQAQMFGKEVVIDSVVGVAGTDFPTGTRSQPVNNLTDALAICEARGLLRIMTRTSLTVEAGHNVDEISFATHGIMGTQIIFQEGCSANKVTIRYASVSGVITLGDMMLIESCQVGNLANFTGILNLVSFSEGCEISVGSWANMIDCYCGGEPENEPEVSIGTSALSITCYCGNLKLTNKTGSNRTIASFRSGSVSIASSCIAGKIQILGTGQVEKDESGPGCQVDVDAALTNEFIADHVWDEPKSEHIADGSLGAAMTDIHDESFGKWILNPAAKTLTLYKADGVSVLKVFDLTDTEADVPAFIGRTPQ